MFRKYKEHIKLTINLAIPVIIGQIGHVAMGVVDSMMIGKLGAAPLAAAALANGLFFLILVLGMGVSFAISPLVAISVGANKVSESGLIFRQAMIVNMVMGIILCLATFFGSEIIYLLNDDPEISVLAVSYTKLLGYSIIPIMFFQTYKQFIEGLSIMRPAMVVTLVANIINFFANWVFIFGNLGMPALGLDGAGWATFASRVFMAISLMLFVSYSGYFNKYNITLKIKEFDFPLIKKIIKLGLPSGFQYFFEVGAFVAAAVMVGWIGTNELAAHQIAINISSITYITALGISVASSIRVGNGVGKKDIIETRNAGFSALLLTVLMMACFGIIFILFRFYLPLFYINDDTVISIASILLLIAAFFQISDGVQAVGLGILRGLTDVKIPTAITFTAYWIIGLPVGYLLGFYTELGVIGVWIGLFLGLFVSAVLLSIRFNIRSRKIVNI